MRYSDIIQILKIYTSFEDKELYKELAPVIAISFVILYSFLLITDGYYFIIFLSIGIAIGIFISYNKQPNFKFQKYQRNLSYNEQNVEQFSNSLDPPKQVELFYPPLTIVVNELLDYAMRDFVLSWWRPINVHNDTTFEKLARERLNVVFLNVQKILLNQDRNDIVMSTLYGVANTLIIHMRECRTFEESHLSMDQYVLENPQSPFGQLFSREEQHQQLRSLSQQFLKRTLPNQDRDSLLLMSLFKELLATFVFGGILNSLSNPDFLNCWIIDLLSDKDKATAIASTISDAVLMENMEDLEEQKDDSSTSSSFEHVSPPHTPEPKQPDPISTRPGRSETLLASLQSPPLQSPLEPFTMIFNRGSVNFTIMDISAPQPTDQPLNKSELVYIIQIERPALEDHAGSEGGGYVITRTYADFETFHTILCAKHPKRSSKLKLPLDVSKSWLKKPSAQKKVPTTIALERYINTVVQDEELGTDAIILPFLRKERQSEMGNGGMMVSFAEEYKDEAALLAANKRRSRNSLQPTLIMEERRCSVDRYNVDQPQLASKEEAQATLEPKKQAEPKKLTEPKRRETQMNKSLSSMDVELLIETTYALVVEIFNLTPTNNKAWMRRSILNLLREIVRRTYAEFISEQYSDFVNEYMSPDAIVATLNRFGKSFWPEGKWILDQEKKVRTEADKQESKQLARDMLMTTLIPNAMRQLIGDQNCNLAMDRIWARMQDPDLNRLLILQVLERIVKPVLG